jgi:hypothetical protein
MLPQAVVEALWLKLMLTYGVRFTSAYPGQDMNVIRAHWAHELQGLTVEQVKHGLSMLPHDRPPTVLGFKVLAHDYREPIKPQPMLERPVSTPEQHARVSERLNAARSALLLPNRAGVEWAHVILEKVATGATPRPTRTAIEMAQSALRSRGLLGTPGTSDDEATA